MYVGVIWHRDNVALQPCGFLRRLKAAGYVADPHRHHRALAHDQSQTSNFHQIAFQWNSSDIEPVGGNGILIPLQSNAGDVGDM